MKQLKKKKIVSITELNYVYKINGEEYVATSVGSLGTEFMIKKPTDKSPIIIYISPAIEKFNNRPKP